MTLLAGEYSSGGRVWDAQGKPVVKTRQTGSGGQAGDFFSGGRLFDVNGYEVVYSSSGGGGIPTFSSVFLSDLFTGGAADLNTHTSDSGHTWTRHGSVAQAMQLSGEGRLKIPTTVNADALYYASAVPASADYEVEAVLTAVNGVDDGGGVVWNLGPAVRIDTAAKTCYMAGLRWNGNPPGVPAGSTVFLGKAVAGVITVLGAIGVTNGAPTVVLKAVGTTLVLTVGGQVLTVTDSSISTAGRPGIFGNQKNADNTWITTLTARQA